MKHLLNLLLLGSTTVLLVTSCAENPADKVEPATVEDPAGNTGTSKVASTIPEDAEVKTFVLSGSSKIEWTGSKVTGSHSGGFSNFVGKFEVAGGQLLPKGRHFVTIDMASVFSDNDKLTEHLKGEDFFDVVKFPIARFQLMKATPVEGSQYEITGMLDLHGVGKKITFPATLEIGTKGNLLNMDAEFSINRKDFEITFPGKPDDLIRDEVVLKFDVSAIPGEPKELVLMDKTEPEEETRDGKGKGGKGGKGRGGKGGDWRNMSEEERQERRRQFMAEMDKNGDGNLGKDEVPERLWNFMGRADANGDDMISESERTEFRAKMEAERELRELTGEGGDGFRGGKGGGKGGGGKGRE